MVEDRYMIADELASEVERLGGTVVGPCANLEAAAAAVSANELDLALLDVNLDGELVFPVAQILADHGVPLIFLTGYDREVVPGAWRSRPMLHKPVKAQDLKAEIKKSL